MKKRRGLDYHESVKRESQRRYSLDEYFAVEETSQVKNEYYDGEIFAMAGASLEHNRIAANLLRLIGTSLLNRGCEVFGSDLRVQTPGGLFTYPDVSIVCGQPHITQGRPDTLTNPVVLIEVLSDATREYDRGQKFTLYQEIPTLREYILVEQKALMVEMFRSFGATWKSEILDNLDAAVSLQSIDLTIPVREMYRLVF
jgi:Uma2 family endonuclease